MVLMILVLLLLVYVYIRKLMVGRRLNMVLIRVLLRVCPLLKLVLE